MTRLWKRRADQLWQQRRFWWRCSDEEDFIESFAKTVIKKGDITIIRAGDGHLYYFSILISEIYKTEAAEKDDYQHEVTASQRVMKCNYLELFRESKDGDIYYIYWREEIGFDISILYCRYMSWVKTMPRKTPRKMGWHVPSQP